MTRAISPRGIDVGSDPWAPPATVIQAIIDGLDQVALGMERKWGIGRLRLLVSDLLRAKFDAQKDKLDTAIASGSETYVRVQADGMRKAWVALDKAATEAGAKPLSPEVWECTLPETGEVVAIVHTEAEASAVCRHCRVFTLAEIAQLIAALGDTVLGIKQAFPGAEIIRVGPAAIDWKKGDPLPF
jgi:hypothetical protein